MKMDELLCWLEWLEVVVKGYLARFKTRIPEGQSGSAGKSNEATPVRRFLNRL
jgi:hypothetical protein